MSKNSERWNLRNKRLRVESDYNRVLCDMYMEHRLYFLVEQLVEQFL